MILGRRHGGKLRSAPVKDNPPPRLPLQPQGVEEGKKEGTAPQNSEAELQGNSVLWAPFETIPLAPLLISDHPASILHPLLEGLANDFQPQMEEQSSLDILSEHTPSLGAAGRDASRGGISGRNPNRGWDTCHLGMQTLPLPVPPFRPCPH